MPPTALLDTNRKSNKEGRAPQRKTSAVAKKKNAGTKRVNAEKLREDLSVKMKALETRLAATTDEEQAPVQLELNQIQVQLFQAEAEKKLAEEEEIKATEEERVADEIDEHDKMDIDEEKKPTIALTSAEGLRHDVDRLAKMLRMGLRLPDPPESLDLTTGIELRDTQAVICYKKGFGKPAIVLDNEIPDWPIYRIRKDVLIQDGCPNLVKSRRAGKVKHPDSDTKWSVDDILKIQGIAIEVPVAYLGNPEELVKLKPPLPREVKDRMEEEKKPIPRLPDVQLLIEWRTALGGEGEDKDRLTSWESRSGCRTLWKKHRITDDLLLRVAEQREVNYRMAGGKHSSVTIQRDNSRTAIMLRVANEEEKDKTVIEQSLGMDTILFLFLRRLGSVLAGPEICSTRR